ncbi:MAG TPA: glycosyl transferase, partial [Desulfobacterales bacterium]|nr:glycosyl transferase [Desulfobacterales bacterium]
FIDDDPLKIGKKLQGYPILGGVEKLASLIKKNDINGLLVSFTNRDSENFESIKSFCRSKGLFLKQFFIHVDDIDLEN